MLGQELQYFKYVKVETQVSLCTQKYISRISSSAIHIKYSSQVTSYSSTVKIVPVDKQQISAEEAVLYLATGLSALYGLLKDVCLKVCVILTLWHPLREMIPPHPPSYPPSPQPFLSVTKQKGKLS